jgi:hypothetical protein
MHLVSAPPNLIIVTDYPISHDSRLSRWLAACLSTCSDLDSCLTKYSDSGHDRQKVQMYFISGKVETFTEGPLCLKVLHFYHTMRLRVSCDTQKKAGLINSTTLINCPSLRIDIVLVHSVRQTNFKTLNLCISSNYINLQKRKL